LRRRVLFDLVLAVPVLLADAARAADPVAVAANEAADAFVDGHALEDLGESRKPSLAKTAS
jgi:hypothetical protein